ncbi:hypothetical protein N665_1900s0001 [Sinapis alba]|nr:hypothetical protein N665_1900s0001 [Sinapis alba]
MENTSWKSDPSIRQTEPHKSYQVHILPEDYWTLPVHTWKEKKLIVIHSELRSFIACVFYALGKGVD